jgi:PTH1 family peptidyl-tRNA hydrolase
LAGFFFYKMLDRNFLIIGLGNPGLEYARTRHNIGFDVVDALAEMLQAPFEDKRYAFRAEARLKGRKVSIIKPTTFMNLSGKAVLYWMKECKVDIHQIMVVTDDINLELGKIRMKARGSDGGHNGLRNIQEALGRHDYPRLRIGVGNDFPKGQQVHYVLGNWSEVEQELVDKKITDANLAVQSFILEGIDRAMNQYNS